MPEKPLNKMKRLLYIFAAALLLSACSEGRENILKVYNWADYIDEDLLGEFEQWYKEQTGEDGYNSRAIIIMTGTTINHTGIMTVSIINVFTTSNLSPI